MSYDDVMIVTDCTRPLGWPIVSPGFVAANWRLSFAFL